jgi:ParB/RepB/Spo0J family partition protein
MHPVIREIELDSLIISPLNVRKDPGDITELIDSVMDIGVLEPILVWPKGDTYEVIAGSRRVQAARSAGHQTIPAIVVEVSHSQAVLVSLIENIQRKDLSLAERVEGYKALQRLNPEYHSHRSLAKVTSLSHQKITQDFQAYETFLRLQPYGIRVASDLPPNTDERQQGEVLPEYHAVLLHQAMSSLVAEGAVTIAESGEKMAELARLIAPMSQEAAKAVIEAVKAGNQPARGTQHFKATRHGASRRKKSSPKGRENGGLVSCSCCNRLLQLVHRADGTHAVVDTPFTRQPQLPAPEFHPQPGVAALPPAPDASDAAPALEALGTPQPILKQTTGYKLNEFPRGMNTILTPHSSGFWGRLERTPANPDFADTDVPESILTLNP